MYTVIPVRASSVQPCVAVPGWMLRSQAFRDIYSCPFTQLLESTHGMRKKANGITPGYPLPPLNTSIHSLPQFRVTESEKEGSVCVKKKKKAFVLIHLTPTRRLHHHHPRLKHNKRQRPELCASQLCCHSVGMALSFLSSWPQVSGFTLWEL